jgi:hypothetical protein
MYIDRMSHPTPSHLGSYECGYLHGSQYFFPGPEMLRRRHPMHKFGRTLELAFELDFGTCFKSDFAGPLPIAKTIDTDICIVRIFFVRLGLYSPGHTTYSVGIFALACIKTIKDWRNRRSARIRIILNKIYPVLGKHLRNSHFL